LRWLAVQGSAPPLGAARPPVGEALRASVTPVFEVHAGESFPPAPWSRVRDPECSVD
jgi:hypothetical protein